MILKRIHLKKALKKTLLWQRLHETESSLWYQRYMQQNAKKNNWKDRKLWWRKILGYCTWFFSNYMKSIILLFKAILDKKSVWTMKRMTREREKRPLTMSYNGKCYQFPQANCGKNTGIKRILKQKSDELFKILMIH